MKQTEAKITTTHIAFLRGINVGGNNKVPMVQLKKVFESLGFTNVSTYINSGNVIFDTPTDDTTTLAHRIEHALEKSFGFKIKTLVRTATSLQKIIKAVPANWTNNTEQKTDVLFLWEEFDTKKTISKIAHDPSVDTLLYISGAIVWHIQRTNYAKSGMHTFIGTTVYKHMTARNINTVRKLITITTR